jgi:hypothetical protein
MQIFTVFTVFRAADGQLIFDAKPLGDGPPTAAYSSLRKGIQIHFDLAVEVDSNPLF